MGRTFASAMGESWIYSAHTFWIVDAPLNARAKHLYMYVTIRVTTANFKTQATGHNTSVHDTYFSTWQRLALTSQVKYFQEAAVDAGDKAFRIWVEPLERRYVLIQTCNNNGALAMTVFNCSCTRW